MIDALLWAFLPLYILSHATPTFVQEVAPFLQAGTENSCVFPFTLSHEENPPLVTLFQFLHCWFENRQLNFFCCSRMHCSLQRRSDVSNVGWKFCSHWADFLDFISKNSLNRDKHDCTCAGYVATWESSQKKPFDHLRLYTCTRTHMYVGTLLLSGSLQCCLFDQGFLWEQEKVKLLSYKRNEKHIFQRLK